MIELTYFTAYTQQFNYTLLRHTGSYITLKIMIFVSHMFPID